MECKFCGKKFRAFGKVDGCSIECRLLFGIKKNNDCWEWQAFIMPNGYGRISYKGIDHYTHRLSYETFKGTIPEKKLVCHTCDNRKCINPEHLWIGTCEENTRDACNKGKMKGWIGKKHSKESILKMRKPHNIDRKGEKHPNSKLNNVMVKEIKDLIKSGMTHREIGDKYSVSRCCISDVIRGKRWSHI
jgi:hypothetical protein